MTASEHEPPPPIDWSTAEIAWVAPHAHELVVEHYLSERAVVCLQPMLEAAMTDVGSLGPVEVTINAATMRGQVVDAGFLYVRGPELLNADAAALRQQLDDAATLAEQMALRLDDEDAQTTTEFLQRLQAPPAR